MDFLSNKRQPFNCVNSKTHIEQLLNVYPRNHPIFVSKSKDLVWKIS
jgi:hypothetical protein